MARYIFTAPSCLWVPAAASPINLHSGSSRSVMATATVRILILTMAMIKKDDDNDDDHDNKSDEHDDDDDDDDDCCCNDTNDCNDNDGMAVMTMTGDN